MKKLIASMFGLSLLALFLLSGESRTIAVDDAGLQLLAHCGECEKKDKGDDDKESFIRMLVKENEDDDKDDKKDGSKKKSRLLADCGKDHGDKEDDDKETRLLADCGKDHGDKEDDKEDSLA